MCCLTYIYFEFYFSGCQFLTNIFPDFDQIFKKSVRFGWRWQWQSVWPSPTKWGSLHIYRNYHKKLERKSQCEFFSSSGGPVLLGHLLGWVLQKCKKLNILLNLATLMVAQMFKHASTMGQGYLGQRWRNLGKCVLRNHFFLDKTSPCTIDFSPKHIFQRKKWYF